MRKQQAIWLKEHQEKNTLPTMANTEPASGVTLFTYWLQTHDIPLSGNAIDIGAGKGRNSVYLAQLGFKVWALEYIEPALAAAQQLATTRHVAGSVQFSLASIDERWDIPDDLFDVAIDSFSSIDVETLEGRKTCRDEMFRTLKPGGYALVTVCSAEDEWEKELITNNPGPEPNSTLWPQNGKFQKNYTEAELHVFYSDFEIMEIKTIRKSAYKLGRNGIATNLWMVIKKPKNN